MKLSKETIEILKNFSTINQSILFKEGKKIRTISPQNNVFAEADVPEEFPVECAIYELPKFLATLSLFDSPELEFTENSVIVSSKKSNHKIKYFYGSKNLVIAPPDKKLVMETVLDTFKLTREELSKVIKASALMQLPHLVIGVKDGKRFIKATNMKSKSSNNFVIDHGMSDADDYEQVLKSDNLKIISDDYEVSVGKIKNSYLFNFSSAGEYFEITVNDKVYTAVKDSDKAEEIEEKLKSDGASNIEITTVTRPTNYFVTAEANF